MFLVPLLAANPLLLVFLVAAIGFPLGRVRWGGATLGVSAVLFVGLVFGAMDPSLVIPELFTTFGLTLFVYTIGLSSGPVFFSSFRKKGITETAFVIAMLGATAAVTILLSRVLFSFDSATSAGLFTGGLNNTPALAAVLDQIKRLSETTGAEPISNPVVAYSIAYPFGVLGTILAIMLARKLWGSKELALSEGDPAAQGKLLSRTILVTRPGVVGRSLSDLARENAWRVVFGRLKRDQRQALVGESTELRLGDQVIVVGTDESLQLVMDFLGERSPEDLATDRTEFDYRRMFVSNPAVFGHRVGELEFLKKTEAVITRIRRGDVEILPGENTVLEPGDRVRVLCRPDAMEQVSKYIGDSYKAVSEIDFLSFSVGLAGGLLLGLVPIPVPGGVTLTLGMAGGPLVVGLILGRLFRTGPVVWVLPYSATMMLRQIGLIVFLAGVGVRSGYAFFNTLLHGDGWQLFIAGSGITLFSAFATLWVGHRVLRIPFARLTGMLAGIQTQPAVLGFTLEQARNDQPNAGYAMVHPIATILKIVLAQMILLGLS